MRDINSLKENEAIHISTKKEAKKIAKLFDKQNAETVIKAFNEYGDIACIELNKDKNFVSYASTDFYKQNQHDPNWFRKTVPASDFLPKKKKKVTREWVEKYVAKALYAKQTQEAVERALQPSKEQISDLVTTDPANLDVKGAEVISGLEEDKSATIIESEKEIDWSVPGHLVQSRVGTIWITSGKNKNSTFEAVCIKGNCDFIEGNIESNLPKYAFHKYTGEPIILSNENKD